MNCYEINGGYQRHLVVCKTMADAERIYKAKYGYGSVRKIELLSEYVLIQEPGSAEGGN
jgi:hypothetical protein